MNQGTNKLGVPQVGTHLCIASITSGESEDLFLLNAYLSLGPEEYFHNITCPHSFYMSFSIVLCQVPFFGILGDGDCDACDCNMGTSDLCVSHILHMDT